MRNLNWLRSFLICTMLLFAAPATASAARADPHAGNVGNASSSSPAASSTRPRDRQSSSSDLAIAELVRIDSQIRQINDQLGRIDARSATRGPIEEATAGLAQLKSAAPQICTGPPEARAEFVQSLEATVQTLRQVTESLPTLYPWEEVQLADLQQSCGPALVATLERFDAGIRRLNGQFGASSASRGDLERQRDALEEEKHDIVTQMSNQVAAARVAATMPWILVIIFGLGLTMMFGARIFNEAIQADLVGSGQLVQFVTILVLFGALLALGLADKLQEQTLAALLGGLAGYVLSQGVGRQERQTVMNAIRTAQRDGSQDAQAGQQQPGAEPVEEQEARQ